MIGRLVLLILAVAVSACDAPPPSPPPAPVAPPAPPAAPISAQQLQERSAQCGSKSKEVFRKAAKEGVAEFAFHYNAKLDTCFYLLTVNRPEKVSRTLVDIYENEIYGQFAETPASKFPEACEVTSLYCASQREWEVLVAPYMEG